MGNSTKLNKMIIIRVYESKWSKDGKDTDYKFIQWVGSDGVVIAVVEDLKTGQIRQFGLDKYVMAFKKQDA